MAVTEGIPDPQQALESGAEEGGCTEEPGLLVDAPGEGRRCKLACEVAFSSFRVRPGLASKVQDLAESVGYCR